MDDVNNSSASYFTEINKIKKSIQPTETKLDLLNLLVKDFLRKKYHIKKNADYSELIDLFLEKKKPHIATFCHQMVENLYSGEVIDNPKIMLILDDAKLMIEKEYNLKPISQEDENTFRTLIKPLMGKENKNISEDKNVSKQTRKIIDKYITVEEDTKMTQNDEFNLDSLKEENEELASLKNRLSLTNQNGSENIQGDKIEGIDNLERIREKIRIKKAYSTSK